MLNKIICGDALAVLKTLPDKIVNCCVTSPPYYGLRDYGVDGQIGLEETPDAYISRLVDVFHEMRRVLKDDGTLWLNIGDSYANSGGKQQPHRDHSGENHRETRGMQGYAAAGGGFDRSMTIGNGIKPKDLIGIPWLLALALRADGWYLRQDIIWSKPNPMPESVADRCTKAHEYIFLLSKSQRYYFDNNAIKEPTVSKDDLVRDRDNTRLNNTPGRTRMKGLTVNNYEMRNRRSVWTVSTHPVKEAHFATFPPELIRPMIRAGCPVGGVVLDPFIGSGTTAVVALEEGRDFLGIDLNEGYIKDIAERRIASTERSGRLFVEALP